MCSLTVGKKILLLKVDKQIQNSNKLNFETHELSFEYLLTYLRLSINGLLEMWLWLLTFYFRSLKGPKNFLRHQPWDKYLYSVEGAIAFPNTNLIRLLDGDISAG